MPSPIRALVVGAGQRGLIYASYAQYHPDELQIVGVAEPDPHRREMTQRLYGFRRSSAFLLPKRQPGGPGSPTLPSMVRWTTST